MKINFKHKKAYLLICFAFLFSFMLVNAVDVSTNPTTNSVKGVNMVIPDAPINYSLIPTVNSSDFWDNLNTPADIDHNLLNNLEWSNAGHTIDSNVDFGGFNITTTGDVTTSKLNVTNTGTDADIIFTGNLNSATLRYESDNDRFVFAKDFKMLTASEIQFRSIGQNIGSSATGVLDISADTSIDIATPLVDLGSGDLDTTGDITANQLYITQDSDTEATGIVMFNPHTFLPPDATESISISAKFARPGGTATDGGKINFHTQGDYIVDMNKNSNIEFYTAAGGTDTLALLLMAGGQANFAESILLSQGNVLIDDDAYSLYLGESQDALLKYDGTNLVINPKVVGSGLVDVDGDILAELFESDGFGSAGAPTFTWNYLEDTGMYAGGIHQLDFSVNGAQQMSVRTDGVTFGGSTHSRTYGTAGQDFIEVEDNQNPGIVIHDTGQGSDYQFVAQGNQLDLYYGATKLAGFETGGDPFAFYNDVNITGNTTFNQLVKLEVISLPTCNSVVNGSIARNSTKLYFCDGISWNGLY